MQPLCYDDFAGTDFSKSLNQRNLRGDQGEGVPLRQLANKSKKRMIKERGKEKNGAPGRSRTSDLLVRSQLLYPAELRAHIAFGCNPLRILEFAVQSKPAPNRLNTNLEELVRPEGLEPPTLWFEARCSIQLSYGRAKAG